MVKLIPENKKAVFRTLEAFIAIFISFFFLIVFLPQQREQALQQAPPNVLASLADNDEFRNCATALNYTCINQTIDRDLDDQYEFKVNLSEKQDSAAPALPEKRVYASSLFFAGNTTNATNIIVRLYFWAKG